MPRLVMPFNRSWIQISLPVVGSRAMSELFRPSTYIMPSTTIGLKPDWPENDPGNITPIESIRRQSIYAGGRMARVSRRQFFRIAAADAAVAGLVAARVVELDANPLGLPIGSQTYPHRAMIKEGNFAELAKILADIGVQRVEMCS